MNMWKREDGGGKDVEKIMGKPIYWRIILGTNLLAALRCLKTSTNLLDTVRVEIEGIAKECAYRLTARSALRPSFMRL